ncbi:MAG: hypothetical protein ACFE85_10730 [Candidatus Hodarchaeota archaeon]
MTAKRLSVYFISLFIIFCTFSAAFPIGKASMVIPEKYSQELDLNQPYIYNVTQFDSKFTWLNLTYSSRGDAITNPGGMIIVNFTGFYNDPSAFGASCFSNPIPYINITFMENLTNVLVTNTTFFNVSNSEAGLSLAIGYNSFHSGFLIQINNITNLKTLAEEQVLESGFLPGDLSFNEYDYMVEFIFRQNNKNQNSTMIYDKATGILVYSEVQSVFGPDLEIQLSDYELNFQKTSPRISSFPLWIFFVVITTVSTLITFVLIRKIKIRKIF